MTTPDPEILRQRARSLRSLAHVLSTGSARLVDRAAQDDTWLGPTATRCAADLASLRSRLDAADRDVRERAARLDAQAEAAERAQRTAAAHPPVPRR